jgi:SAM-dependent methyltransferase
MSEPPSTPDAAAESVAEALARLYDLDLADDPGDLDLYLALAAREGGPVVELAVGSGRVALPLAAAGHQVTGVDLDPAMLSRARTAADAAGPELAARLRLEQADLLTARPAGSGKFRLAILALNSILLLAGRGQQRRALASMAALLAPGGLAVVDAWQPDTDDLARYDGRLVLEWLRRDPVTGRDATKTAAAWYDAATRVVTLTQLFDEGRPGQPAVRWTRTDALRLVTADELVAHAEAAGLRVELVAGDHGLGPLGPGSERIVLLARKPARRSRPVG